MSRGAKVGNQFGKKDPALGLQQAQHKAIEKGGRCVSDKYEGYNKHLFWKCGENGHPVFRSTWTAVVHGNRWCPHCAISKRQGGKVSEGKIRDFLQVAFGKAFPSVKPMWNSNQMIENPFLLEVEKKVAKKVFKSKRYSLLELDGYCLEMGVAFEYQGKQHYELDLRHKPKDRLKKLVEIQLNDYQKKLNCKNNNVVLVEIPYFADNKHYNFDYILGVVVNSFSKQGIKLEYTKDQIDHLKTLYQWK